MELCTEQHNLSGVSVRTLKGVPPGRGGTPLNILKFSAHVWTPFVLAFWFDTGDL